MSKLFFGKDGKRVYSRRSLLYDKERIYYDSSGKKIGYSRPSYFLPGQTNYYDRSGKKVGHSHKSYLYDNQTNYYNNRNEKQGTSRKSYLYDDVNVYHDRNRRYKGFDIKPIIDPYPDDEKKNAAVRSPETIRNTSKNYGSTNRTQASEPEKEKDEEKFGLLSVLGFLVPLMLILGSILGKYLN